MSQLFKIPVLVITIILLPHFSFGDEERPERFEPHRICIAAASPVVRGMEPSVLRGKFQNLKEFLSTQFLGQNGVLDKVLLALLVNGHILLEGPPGVAKTRLIKSLSEGVESSFQRVQFVPDLMPSDITGSYIYDPQTGGYKFEEGPVFANFLLADEINRAPEKTQSALLEAMEEGQVTVGRETHSLEDVFLVLATQNPIDRQGTYDLPPAQLDRFLMKIVLDFPEMEIERQIMRLRRREAVFGPDAPATKLSLREISEARRFVALVGVPSPVEDYILKIVQVTRNPQIYLKGEMKNILQGGVGTRGVLGLEMAAQARAWLDGRREITIEDVKEVAADVLRHRLPISEIRASATGDTEDDLIEAILVAAETGERD